QLSSHVKVLPIVGEIPHALMWASIGWAVLGTVILMVVGMKLPGLEFNNQKVEAAYRKELVYGEDYADRAHPLTFKNCLAECAGIISVCIFTMLISTWFGSGTCS